MIYSSPCFDNSANGELINMKIEKAIEDKIKSNPELFKGDKGDKGDKGQDFTIKKTFPSVEAMNSDTSLNEGDFVLITSNENDEDNAKLFVKTKDGYQFITDLSGAKGIKGDKGDPGQDGHDGSDGRDGLDGRSITQTGSEQDADGNTVVNLSDGSSFKVSKGAKGDKGEDGRNGVDGRDATPLTVVSSTINNDGNTITTLSDGSQIITQKGADGQNGRDLTVTRTETDSDGNTILTFSDGTTAKIQKGDKGADGRDGVDGHDKVQVSATEPTDPNISLWIKPDGENCCTVSCADLDARLDDYYRKHETVSKQNLKELTLYHLNQTENSADYDYHHSGHTTIPDFRRVMTYSKATGLGIIHLDFEKIDGGGSTNKDVIFRLPDDAPTPISYIEFKDGANRVFMGPHERIVYMQGNLKERTLINLIGYFDY